MSPVRYPAARLRAALATRAAVAHPQRYRLTPARTPPSARVTRQLVMAEFTRRSQRRENEYATRGHGYQSALCRGQAQAGEYAVDAIDEAIAAAFDLWCQIDAMLGRYDQDANGPSPELPGLRRPPRPR